MENIDFDKSQTLKFVSDKFKLFDIPQLVFGEKILEYTVKLFDRTTDNDYIIQNPDRVMNLCQGLLKIRLHYDGCRIFCFMLRTSS